MTHHVKLTRNHQRILLEALAESQEIKQKKLRNPNSIARMDQEYYKAARRLIDDPNIECGRLGTKPEDNLFGWLLDQLHHSGNLPETEFGQTAMNICRAAANNEYTQFTRMTIISKLFE